MMLHPGTTGAALSRHINHYNRTPITGENQ